MKDKQGVAGVGIRDQIFNCQLMRCQYGTRNTEFCEYKEWYELVGDVDHDQEEEEEEEEEDDDDQEDDDDEAQYVISRISILENDQKFEEMQKMRKKQIRNNNWGELCILKEDGVNREPIS
ncbi:MAG: hypothetical protein EZS28_013799 [Streblomastix strix]|uniref:Uncharacterized protein n=1 Tax=Streblomastix strix TaxID=222440 RepID=A0A5J4W7P9_9EUKA|nr:MAG: hypothetical protein EZS28_013799 [Streblomastix strix]